MINTLFALLLAFSSNALDLDTVVEPHLEKLNTFDPFPFKQEVQEKMQVISEKLAAGRVPTPGLETEFYTGQCLTSYSAVAQPQIYSAKVAIRTQSDALEITYVTVQGTYEVLGAQDIPKLQKLYVPKAKSYEIMISESGEYAQFKMAEASASLPAIYSAVSVDKANADKMYFVAIFMGYYCELDRVK